MRVRGASLAEIIAEAGEAIGRMLCDEVGETAAGPDRALQVTGRDAHALLVHWLNEILYLAEVDHWAPTSVLEVVLEDNTLRARCAGVRLARAPARVKAATFHGLHQRDADAGSEVEVVLDV